MGGMRRDRSVRTRSLFSLEGGTIFVTSLTAVAVGGECVFGVARGLEAAAEREAAMIIAAVKREVVTLRGQVEVVLPRPPISPDARTPQTSRLMLTCHTVNLNSLRRNLCRGNPGGSELGPEGSFREFLGFGV